MIIAIILAILNLFTPINVQAPMIIPPMPAMSPEAAANEAEAIEWDEFWSDSFVDHASQFDAIFNAIEYKVAKNGRSMVKGTNAKGYRFI